MSKFREAIIQVVENRDETKYPQGMNAGEVLSELCAKESELGLNLSLTTMLDVRDELEALYKPIRD